MRVSAITVVATGALAVFLSMAVRGSDSRLLGQEAQAGPTLRMVRENPGKYVGAFVIWGGQIQENRRTATGSELTVLAFPLDPEGVPIASSAAEGRFLARSFDDLDPNVFAAGHYLTINGQITAVDRWKSGQAVEILARVHVQDFHLWLAARDHDVPGSRDWLYDRPWDYHGWNDLDDYPYWHYPPHRRHRRHFHRRHRGFPFFPDREFHRRWEPRPWEYHRRWDFRHRRDFHRRWRDRDRDFHPDRKRD